MIYASEISQIYRKLEEDDDNQNREFAKWKPLLAIAKCIDNNSSESNSYNNLWKVATDNCLSKKIKSIENNLEYRVSKSLYKYIQCTDAIKKDWDILIYTNDMIYNYMEEEFIESFGNKRPY